MRIDFSAGYNQVQKLLQTRAPVAEEIPAFEEAIAPENINQAPDITVDTASLAKTDGVGARASLDLAAPGILLPELLPQELPTPPSPAVKEANVSVKTPSGVRGRYVKLEDPFKGMSAPERSELVGKIVYEAGEEHGVDPALGMGVIKAESNFNAIAVSNDGHSSKGLMQLLDSTGKEMMSRLGKEERAYSPFDPELNVDLGVGYLKRLHEIFSSPTDLGGKLKTVPAANSSSLEKLAVAAYNAGEGRVAAAQQRAQRLGRDAADYDQIKAYLPETTQQYVERVMQSRSLFSAKNKEEEVG